MNGVTNKSRTAYRTCSLCEAMCGLEIAVEGDHVVRVRGDQADVFSGGYVCPKGVAIGELHHDPDRLRAPLIKTAQGFREASWDDAYARVAEGLAPILARGDRNAVGVYIGNPAVHNMGISLYIRPLMRALKTKNLFSASTVDQMPKHVVNGWLFGDPHAMAVPDIDRCQFLLMLGANPWESNGSLWTAPGLPLRLKALIKRGGRLAVIDPRRTRTAEHASEHHFITPGTDALWLLGIAHVIVNENLARPGRLAEFTRSLDELKELLAQFTPDAVATQCGIDAAVTMRLARELAATERGAVYARFGPHATQYGTAAAWATELLNILTGNLDREGGVMFPRAPHDRVREPEVGTGFTTGRWHSRVRHHPEVLSEFPAASLAEEIDTPGAGQIRAMITLAGNPVLSTPAGAHLSRALESLEFMVSVDVYLNETTRHADVILPPASPLEKSHYDLFFSRFAVRHIARYSPPVFVPDQPTDDAILAKLALIARGDCVTDTSTIDDEVLNENIAKEIARPNSSIAGREQSAIRAQLFGDSPCDRLLDFMLRTGPYGDGFQANDGLSLAKLCVAPHGIDLGALEPQLPSMLNTKSGAIELVNADIKEELGRLAVILRGVQNDGLLLIGRREFQSNNSWMHNLPSLASGHAHCVLHMHPMDAQARGLVNGSEVRLSSTAGSVMVPLAINHDIKRGVVSLPHGYGHQVSGVRLGVAANVPGASANDVTEPVVDRLSGNGVLNGVPVDVRSA